MPGRGRPPGGRTSLSDFIARDCEVALGFDGGGGFPEGEPANGGRSARSGRLPARISAFNSGLLDRVFLTTASRGEGLGLVCRVAEGLGCSPLLGGGASRGRSDRSGCAETRESGFISGRRACAGRDTVSTGYGVEEVGFVFDGGSRSRSGGRSSSALASSTFPFDALLPGPPSPTIFGRAPRLARTLIDALPIRDGSGIGGSVSSRLNQ